MKTIYLILFTLFSCATFANESNDIQKLLEATVNNSTSVGVVIGVIDRGEVSYYCFGKKSIYSDGDVTEETLFEIGSITKVFTTTLLMDLVNKNQLSLNDTVAKHLPEINNLHLKDIKLIDLATHFSGLPRLPDNLGIEEVSSEKCNPYKDYTKQELYNYLLRFKPERASGEGYEYSNLGMGLLGHIIAKSVNRNYEDLIKERVSEPLGMNNTTISEPGDNFSKGHWMGKEVQYWDFGVLEGCGALRSNLKDLSIFLSANMGAVNSMLSGTLRDTYQKKHEINDNLSISLGWTISDNIIFHNGLTNGFSSFIGFDLEKQKGIVVLSNSNENIATSLGFSLFDEELQHIDMVSCIDENFLKQFIGDFEINISEDQRRVLHIDLYGNQLILGVRDPAYNAETHPLDFSHSNTFHLRGFSDITLTFNSNKEVILDQFGEKYLANKLENR